MNRRSWNWVLGLLAVMPLAPAVNADCTYDIDSDCRVGLADLTTLLRDFGCPAGCAGDVDRDGDVDLTDLSLLLAQFGNDCTPAAPDGAYVSMAIRGAIAVCWSDNAADESGYRLYRRDGSGDPNDPNDPNTGGDWQLVVETPPGASCATDNAVEVNAPYEYVVRAFRDNCESGGSNAVMAIIPSDPNCPAAPSGLHAVDVTDDQATLCWSDNSEDESGFRLYRRDDPNSVEAWRVIAEIPAGATCATDPQVDPNTAYEYTVRAYRGACESGPSNSVVVIIPSPPPCSTAPANLRVTDVNPNSVSVCWDDLSQDEAGFRLYRRDPNDPNAPEWQLVGETAASVTCTADTTVDPNSTYEYAVRAFRGTCESKNSNTILVVVNPLCPNAPSNLRATDLDPYSMIVHWDDNSGNEAGFRIWYRTAGSGWIYFRDEPANDTGIRITGLQPNTDYWVLVRAFNACGESSDCTGGPYRTADCRSAAPSNLRATDLDPYSMIVHWDDNSNDESGFRIWYHLSGGNWMLFGDQPANDTGIRITGLVPNTDYWVLVRAFNACGESGDCTGGPYRTADCRPAAPSNLRATDLDPYSMIVHWDDHSGNEDGFRIWYRTASFGWIYFRDEPANDTGIRITGLVPNTDYWVLVRAFNACGESGDCTGGPHRTADCRPAAPSNLRATDLDPRSMIVHWDDNSNDEDGFRVWYRTNSSGWIYFRDEPANDTGIRITGLQPNTRYWVLIRAFNACGESGDCTGGPYRTAQP